MNTSCIQDSSVALESSYGTSLTYSVSQLAWGGNLYSSDLRVEELVLPALLRMAPGYHSLNPFVQKEEVVGRNK